MSKEMISHPSHYNQGKIEVIEFIEDQQLDFHLGNVLKYICRAGKKDPTKEIEDLSKSKWYLERRIELLKAEKENREPVRPNDMNPREGYKTTLRCLREDCDKRSLDLDSDFCAEHMPTHIPGDRDQADKHDSGEPECPCQACLFGYEPCEKAPTNNRKELCRDDCKDPACDGEKCWTQAQLELESLR